MGTVIDDHSLMNRFFKYTLLFVGLCLLFSFDEQPIFLQDNDDGYVHWNERKLKWSDFQGEIPPDSKFHALTHSAISLDFEGEGVVLKFDIQTIFDPNKSWKKEGVDSYILNHEQVHFDITEYHARLLRKKLKTNRYKSIETISDEVKELFNDAFDNANNMQLKYDEETNHSINRKKQKKWDKKLKKLLNSTSAYRNPKLKVNVSYLLD